MKTNHALWALTALSILQDEMLTFSFIHIPHLKSIRILDNSLLILVFRATTSDLQSALYLVKNLELRTIVKHCSVSKIISDACKGA